MKSTATILMLLVLLAAGGVGLFFVLQGEDGDPDADGRTLAGGTEEQKTLSRELAATQWLVDGEFAPSAIAARLATQNVSLTDAERETVLPLLAAHLKKLRANLEAAEQAARGSAPPAQRVRYTVAAVKAHGELQRALGGLVAPETAKAVFRAFPAMMPPNPATRPHKPAGSAPVRSPDTIHVPAPAPK